MNRRNSISVSLCIALVGVATLAAGGVAADAGPGDPSVHQVSPTTADAAANGSVDLGRAIVTVDRGEVVTIPLRLESTEEATVRVGGPDVGFNVSATVTDGNGDGAVPLEFHTGSVGTMRTRLVPADDADDYAELSAGPDGTVPAADYPIDVYVGHGVAGEPDAIGTLVVNEAGEAPNASVEHDGSALTLQPAGGQVVEGTTDLASGRNVTVRLRSSGSNPFLRSKQVSVGEGGGFSASFDLSGVDAPTNATATVRASGQRIAGPVEVMVVEESHSSTPGQPGFDVVVALVAVLSAVAVARAWRH